MASTFGSAPHKTFDLNSLFGYDVMTQEPQGDLYLQRGTERAKIDLGEREGLYENAVRHFNLAVKGMGEPFATGCGRSEIARSGPGNKGVRRVREAGESTEIVS